MSITEAAKLLDSACKRASCRKRKKEAIVLFGIKYAGELRYMSRSSSLTRVLRSIVKKAGIGDPYHTELRLGVHLEEFVTLPGNLPFFD